MYSILSFIFLLYVSSTSQEIKRENNNTTLPAHIVTAERDFRENLLCRSCGNDLTSAVDIISKISPASKQSFYDKIFDDQEILVQVLPGELFFAHPVITASRSSCIGVGEWEEKDTWFPGYRWKPCVCPNCGEYIGWVFEPKYPNFVEPPSTFFGLILSGLIGESCKYDSLIGDWFVGSVVCVCLECVCTTLFCLCCVDWIGSRDYSGLLLKPLLLF